jgi:hypothetical protein
MSRSYLPVLAMGRCATALDAEFVRRIFELEFDRCGLADESSLREFPIGHSRDSQTQSVQSAISGRDVQPTSTTSA